MDSKGRILHFPIFIFLFFFLAFFPFACSFPSWFPLKKASPNQVKMKELLDKEIILIDREQYVKVPNPRASEKGNEAKYLYVPVNEYLSRKETFTPPPTRKEEIRKEPPTSTMPPVSTPEKETVLVSPVIPSSIPDLKKKVLITYFDDGTASADEMFGDWVAEKLVGEVDRKSERVLFVDYQMVKEFLEQRGVPLTDLETPKVLQLLNEVFGIHALVSGHLTGPYVFATKTPGDQDETASAIIKVETRLVDASTGKTLKNLSASNPITASKERGTFSEERAKVKAIDLTIADLSRSLSQALDGLDWSCRIVKVDSEKVYLNAGRLTGLKVGDVLEVFRPRKPGEQDNFKTKIQISAFLGIDASVGKPIDGAKPDVNDILKLAKHEGI